MPPALCLALLLVGGPGEGFGAPKYGVPDRDDRVFIELSPGIGRVGPGLQDPKVNFTGGFGVFAVLRSPNSDFFKTQLGAVGFWDHAALLGAIDRVPVPAEFDHPTYAGTLPDDFRGEIVRGVVQTRIGAENDLAFGYGMLRVGWVGRFDEVECRLESCERSRIFDQGMVFGVGLGMQFWIWRGFTLGLDLSYDQPRYFGGHPNLPSDGHIFGARMLIGWAIESRD